MMVRPRSLKKQPLGSSAQLIEMISIRKACNEIMRVWRPFFVALSPSFAI